MRSLLPVIVGALLFTQVSRAQNLLQNGSFESPDADPGTALLTETIAGWTN